MTALKSVSVVVSVRTKDRRDLHDVSCEMITLNYELIAISYIPQCDCLVQSTKSLMHILGNVHD